MKDKFIVALWFVIAMLCFMISYLAQENIENELNLRCAAMPIECECKLRHTGGLISTPYIEYKNKKGEYVTEDL